MGNKGKDGHTIYSRLHESKRFYARHFSVNQLCDDGAYLLSVASLPSLPHKGGQRSIYIPWKVHGLVGRLVAYPRLKPSTIIDHP